jgi:hypothetical protein
MRHEISFLRWLQSRDGRGARSGNNWLGDTARLVRAGYVDAQADRFSPNTTHYVLTDSGRKTLDELENS